MRDDELIVLIKQAGRVAVPPARDEAYRKAMRAARPVTRVGMRRAFTMLTAAAFLALPAGVFQAAGRLDAPPDQAVVVDGVPQPNLLQPNASKAGTQDQVADPADRTDPLTDPQPELGNDDKGHKGQAEPAGPTGAHTDERSQSEERGLIHRPS